MSERITIKDGAVQQSNFYDYRVPRLNEVPAMHIEVIPTDNAPSGVGQMATPLVAPAIGNAIARLASVWLRSASTASVRTGRRATGSAERLPVRDVRKPQVVNRGFSLAIQRLGLRGRR